MRITGSTKIYAIFGYPVEHSLSPAMQNAAFAALGLDSVYIPWKVPPKGFPATLQAVRRMENFGGGSVTVPHKERACELCDVLSPEANAFGAVNTLVAQDGRLLGHNTDGAAFLRSLVEDGGFDPKGKRVLIMGAGGAAKAVAFALAGAGVAELFLANRTHKRAEALAAFLQGRHLRCQILALDLHKSLASALASADLVVNATSMGLKPEDPSPINCGPLSPRALAIDLIYNPPDTAFLREARRRGLRVQNGLGMLLYQGAAAFELWTKKAAPLEVMRATLQREAS